MSCMISIKCDGKWDGNIAAGNRSFNIEGTGDWYTTIHDVDRASVIVSKADDSTGSLIVKLYGPDNKLIKEGYASGKFAVVSI